jgi:hypothetical protein
MTRVYICSAQRYLQQFNSIDLHSMDFNDNVTKASRSVALTGGYYCDYGTRMNDSVTKGLTIGASISATINGITLRLEQEGRKRFTPLFLIGKGKAF